jgi:hypothetical protein
MPHHKKDVLGDDGEPAVELAQNPFLRSGGSVVSIQELLYAGEMA